MKSYKQQLAAEYNWLDKKIKNMNNQQVRGTRAICCALYAEKQQQIVQEISK